MPGVKHTVSSRIRDPFLVCEQNLRSLSIDSARMPGELQGPALLTEF